MPSSNCVVAKAGLISKGYITETNSGAVVITDKGYQVADKVWLELNDELRLLLSAYIKRRIIRNVMGDKGKSDA